MFRTTLLAAVAALATVTSAQLNYTTSGPLNITASQVDINERNTWCTAQKASCPNICDSRATPNTCDPNSLSYNCTCENGNTPNISDYQQTLPSFVCGVWVANCVDAHPNDLDGIAACRSVICGNRTSESAADNSTSHTSSGSGSSATSSPSSTTGSGGAASTTSAAPSVTTTGAAIALSVAQSYGTGIMLTGLLAIFGLAL